MWDSISLRSASALCCNGFASLSDAIAIAVRFDAPIFVAEGILESAGEE